MSEPLWVSVEFEVEPSLLMEAGARVEGDKPGLPDENIRLRWNEARDKVRVVCPPEHGAWSGLLVWSRSRGGWVIAFDSKWMTPSYCRILVDVNALDRMIVDRRASVSRLTTFWNQLP
jgi:hypothetical protein